MSDQSPDRLAAEQKMRDLLRLANGLMPMPYIRETAQFALDEIAAMRHSLTSLQSERDALKHDIERHVRIAAEEAEARVGAERERDTFKSLYDAKVPIHQRRYLPRAEWPEGDCPLTASFWPECTCVECYALHKWGTAEAALLAVREGPVVAYRRLNSMGTRWEYTDHNGSPIDPSFACEQLIKKPEAE